MKAVILAVVLCLCASVAQASNLVFANACGQAVVVQNQHVVQQRVFVQNAHQQVFVQRVVPHRVVVQQVRNFRRNNVVLVQDTGLVNVRNTAQFGLFNFSF